MLQFTLVSEKNDIAERISYRHAAMKKKLLSMMEWNTIEDLTDKLKIMYNSISNGEHIKLPMLKTAEQIIGFWNDNYTEIDNILKETEWFGHTPRQMGIESIHIYIIKGTKRALCEMCKQILQDL